MTAAIHTARPVTANDRLGMMLFFAATLHAVVILGITFDFVDRLNSENEALPKLEVTLVNTRSNEKPDEADYLAQSNQQGSGNTEEKTRPQSPPEAAPEVIPNPGNSIRTAPPQTASKAASELEKDVMTAEEAEKKILVGEELQKRKNKIPVAAELIRRSIEMARLEADLSDALKVYSKHSRSKLLVPNSMSHAEAAYLDAWQKKVELVGNMNYPEKAIKGNLSGNLLLLVAISADGNISGIELLRSSGKKILDDAAIRIVKLAAPYPPLPENIRRDTDILKIPRTWKFLAGNRLMTTN